MEEFLKQSMGKEVDIAFGTMATVRGEIFDVKDGLLYLRDEHERVAYAAIDKITVVWEVKEHQIRPGFVG